MKSEIAAIAVSAVLALTAVAGAAPTFTPFLSVDFNGSGGGPATSPTMPGYSAFGVANTEPSGAVSAVISGCTVTIAKNAAATGATLTSRDRGATGSAGANSALVQDFALVLRDTSHALGYSYLQISVAGLTPNTLYEFTGISIDPFSAGVGTNREGYSTAVPAEYAPAAAYANAPTGPNIFYTPVMVAPVGQYDQAVSFNVTSDASGLLTVYAWGDATDYANQTATIVNAIQLGLVVPEPSMMAMGLPMIGLMLRRRR